MPNQLIQRLAALAPKLRPEQLHRVIDAYGLEDCVDLVAQATPAQLSHIFDIDLWRPASPGLDEQFDAARFGLWLEVLVDAGPEIAAAKIAEMPLPQIVAGLVQHVRVFDVSAVSSYETSDGDTWDYSRPVRDVVGCEIAGYHVAAKREDAWDAIVDMLVALDMHHQDRFVELMRAVRSRSHSRREEDGFHSLLQNRDQMMFDVTVERERRRSERGFASPADARAFLQMSRTARLGSIQQPNPIARQYFRAIETGAVDETGTSSGSGTSLESGTSIETGKNISVEIAELLAEAGITSLEAPRALLESGDVKSSSRIQDLMRTAFERDPVAYSERNFELAYLANILISGCSIQSRPFTQKEAADGAVAICSLGLERLPDCPDDYLIKHDLIGAFQIGWSALHNDVCLYAANALAGVLCELRVDDEEMQGSLNLLRIRLLREIDAGTPWRAANALDVLTTIDMTAWAALVALIAECPVIHAGLRASLDHSVRSVDPNAFAFIAHPDQIDLIRNFMRELPSILN